MKTNTNTNTNKQKQKHMPKKASTPKIQFFDIDKWGKDFFPKEKSTSSSREVVSYVKIKTGKFLRATYAPSKK